MPETTFFDDDRARQHDAASIYEQTAEPLTSRCIPHAFDMVGGITPGMAVIDVAAGPGALSLSAARAGARVLATDISTTMVRRLNERLQPYPECEARVMDAQAVDLADDTFDATFSMFGVINLPEWRRALRELARITRPGGYGCISTWQDPNTVASVGLLVEAMAEVLPHVRVLDVPEGVTVAADPDLLRQEMTGAGFGDTQVRSVEVAWEFPSFDEFSTQLDQVYGFMPAYVDLAAEDRDRLNPALRRAAERHCDSDGVLRTYTTALVAAGQTS